MNEAGPPPPSFSCIVYLRVEDNRTKARVANLEDIEVEGDGERSVLQKIVPLFKSKVSEQLASGGVCLLDPPKAKTPDEVRRILPVHL